MTNPIQDEFTNMPINRQLKYQLRKQAAGLCTSCGVKATAGMLLCEQCRQRKSKQHRIAYRLAHGIPLDTPPWSREYKEYKKKETKTK